MVIVRVGLRFGFGLRLELGLELGFGFGLRLRSGLWVGLENN